MTYLLSFFFTPAYAGTLFTMPDATTTLAAVGAWSSPVFNDFLPLIEMVLGILIVAFIIFILIRAFMHH